MNMDPHADQFVDANKMIQGTGAKHDEGKPRAGLMVEDFAHALLEVSKVSTFGCSKYAPRSWTTVPNARERYSDALMRHLLAAAGGEVNDPESGLPHAAHACWNALAVLELSLARTGVSEA